MQMPAVLPQENILHDLCKEIIRREDGGLSGGGHWKALYLGELV